MNSSNFNNNFEQTILHASIANLNNYIRTLNSSIEYLNNATANVRYMQEHINYYYHMNNYRSRTYNTPLIYSVETGTNTETNTNTEYSTEYFEELSLTNLKNIINNNITECGFSELDEPLNESCSITHEEFLPESRVTKINACQHIFNSQAINEWLITHQTCPNCRYNILIDSNIISYTDQESNVNYFFKADELLKYICFIPQSS
uniref:RING-type domain-containing protein n=1 Tax=viral metagenome TaxID=1070528 RepID=A0A6C0DY94_9ZZZZ